MAQPLSIQSRLQQALALHHLGRLAEARAIYEDILRAQPTHFDASYLRATALFGMGDAHGALAAFDAALALNGAHPMAHANRAGCLVQLGRLPEAVAAFDRALQLQPGYAAAWLHRALVLQQMGEAHAALESVGRALALQPDLTGAAPLAAQLRAQLGVQGAAPPAPPARADVRPSGEENRRAAAEYLDKLAQFEQLKGVSAQSSSSVDTRAPQNDDWSLLEQAGRMFADLQQFAQAADEFEKAIAAGAPPAMQVRGLLLEAVRSGVLWQRLPVLHAAIEEDLARGVASVSPLTWQLESDDAASQLRCSLLHARANAPSAAAPRPAPPPPAADGRIRVAYLSADFAQHPVMRQLVEVFELHDRSAFEIHAWGWGGHTGDGMNARCARAIEHFHDARQMSDAQVAAHMRAAGIDIAIDLMGHTKDARAGIFALRPAPVAVNFLGYPGSSALDFIDYIVADATLIPPELECHYSERVLRLPGCYLPTDRQRPAGTPPAREAMGLPPHAFVFCAHSHPRKISPHVFAIWMRLLAQLEGSVL
ncbi:MAG: tetratricopeptide repeat protein, partial [Ottowia sp.]|nr:tetratricopeptide repeat protein [Ottowia sp.]